MKVHSFHQLVHMALNAHPLFLQVVFIMGASGVWEQMWQWVYYADPNNNLITYLQVNIFQNYCGTDLGIMLYTWLKISFWVIVTGVMAWYKIIIRV